MWAGQIAVGDTVFGAYASACVAPVAEADITGKAVGRPLRYQEVPPDVAAQQFERLGVGAEFGYGYVAVLAGTVGVSAIVTDDVEKILGRPATTFVSWVSSHRNLFTN